MATRLHVAVLAPVKDAGSSPMARGTLTGTLGSPQLRNTGQGEDDALSITTSAMLQTGDMLPKKRTTLNSGFNTASGLFGTVTSPDALKPEGRPELRATFMTGGATARRNSGLRAFYNAIAQEVALTKVGAHYCLKTQKSHVRRRSVGMDCDLLITVSESVNMGGVMLWCGRRRTPSCTTASCRAWCPSRRSCASSRSLPSTSPILPWATPLGSHSRAGTQSKPLCRLLNTLLRLVSIHIFL
jgi:hypothetical protein